MAKKTKKAAAAAPAPGFPLLKHIDGLLDTLRGLIPKAFKSWDEEAVHQSRVSTRRLKAAIDLLEPVLTTGHRKSFAKVLKTLRRELGPLRDLDVMLGHLKEMESDERSARAARWGAEMFNDCRKKEREAAAREVSISRTLSKLGRWWGLREEVVEAEEAVDTLIKQSVHLQLDSFMEQAELLIAKEQAGDAPPTLAEGAAHTDPHGLRIAGKRLRYTLEMAEREGFDLGGVQKTFKQMQECLGLWHDYVVLSDRLLSTAVARQLSHQNARLQEEVLDLSRNTLRRSTKELDRFIRLWCEKGESLAKSLRSTFPLTVAVEQVAEVAATAVTPCASESETDPDPSGSPETLVPPVDPPAASPAA